MLQVFFTISKCFDAQVSPAPFAKEQELPPHVGIDYVLIQRDWDINHSILSFLIQILKRHSPIGIRVADNIITKGRILKKELTSQMSQDVGIW